MTAIELAGLIHKELDGQTAWVSAIESADPDEFRSVTLDGSFDLLDLAEKILSTVNGEK